MSLIRILLNLLCRLLQAELDPLVPDAVAESSRGGPHGSLAHVALLQGEGQDLRRRGALLLQGGCAATAEATGEGVNGHPSEAKP